MLGVSMLYACVTEHSISPRQHGVPLLPVSFLSLFNAASDYKVAAVLDSCGPFNINSTCHGVVFIL